VKAVGCLEAAGRGEAGGNLQYMYIASNLLSPSSVEAVEWLEANRGAEMANMQFTSSLTC
jgi:hypothetical protein